ncbi:hypothetical protein JCM19231_4197 [Vibrio ishigakensis]|uniref:Uncharacterized protein n=2 Tax=Vibrio ishigakensis TaxID=1481914 RepID=A0A0B8NTA5_9VIBR|nr:hypothetical protein JCM19231_4197 [Vibrio ishigakensis]
MTAINQAVENAPPMEKKKKSLNPVIILLGVVFAALLLTYTLDSGEFQRDGKLIVPGSYQVLDKDVSP